MNFKAIILLFGFIILLCRFDTLAQNKTLLTNGKIDNKGTIKLTQRLLNQTGGNIDNEDGQIIIDAPNTIFTQDTLLGRIDYISKLGGLQYVPQITYFDIRMSGDAKKMLSDPVKRLKSLSRFVTDPEVRIDMETTTQIDILGYITHNGHMNFGKRDGRVALVGNDSQNIDGAGVFKQLDLDNTEGADVINSGGFKVNTTLELIKGVFRNDTNNNFTLTSGSQVIRHTGAEVLNKPLFEDTVSVVYVGDGHMFTGPEIPDAESILADLTVENVEGITLSKHVTANRNIIVGTKINTEIDDNNRFVLTSTSDIDPQFTTANSEIIGSFRRTRLKDDSVQILFNNRYTYVLFRQGNLGGASEMTMRVIPNQLPPNGDPSAKVKRNIYVSAADITGSEITTGLSFEMGYAWRHSTDQTKDETNKLNPNDVVLQRWTNSDWADNKSSKIPQLNIIDEWAHSSAITVTELGQFAIGISDIGQLLLSSKAILEGPYRWGSMATDLVRKNLIPKTPPNVFPYNLDPLRDQTIADTIMPNVVDWVLLEFRTDRDGLNDRKYICALILQDGQIVETDGVSPLRIARANMAGGSYFVALRHRNHLGIITRDAINIYPGTSKDILDFTDHSKILNGSTELKAVDVKPDQTILWALVAGDVNQDGVIDDSDALYDNRDYINVWNNRDIEAYVPWDITLSGIIHTRDMNMSWNNRGRIAIMTK